MNQERFDLIKLISSRLLMALLTWLMVCIVILVGFCYFTCVVPVAMVTLCLGILGGFISLHRRLKLMSIYDLRLLGGSWHYMILSPFVGGIFACLFYIVCIGGLIGGELFPNFKLDVADQTVPGSLIFIDLFEVRAAEISDYAKLLIWSFISGFSEKFVVNVLGQLESSAAKKVDSMLP